MAGGRASRMYKDSPSLGRGESGDMEVSRKTRMSQDHGGAQHSVEAEAIPHPVRHAHERTEMKHKHLHQHMQMHSRHEHEHAMHDHAGHGPKGEMHGRHHAEMEAMHKQHEQEQADMASRHDSEGDGGEAGGQGPETGGGQIQKIEGQE